MRSHSYSNCACVCVSIYVSDGNSDIQKTSCDIYNFTASNPMSHVVFENMITNDHSETVSTATK